MDRSLLVDVGASSPLLKLAYVRFCSVLMCCISTETFCTLGVKIARKSIYGIAQMVQAATVLIFAKLRTLTMPETTS